MTIPKNKTASLYDRRLTKVTKRSKGQSAPKFPEFYHHMRLGQSITFLDVSAPQNASIKFYRVLSFWVTFDLLGMTSFFYETFGSNWSTMSQMYTTVGPTNMELLLPK